MQIAKAEAFDYQVSVVVEFLVMPSHYDKSHLSANPIHLQNI